jgi:hypothetical protein
MGSVLDFARSQLDTCLFQGLLYCFAAGLAMSQAGKVPVQLSLADIMTIVQAKLKALKASDPRDIIFGLLGMIRQWDPKQRRVEPKYSSDYIQVYTTTSLSLM